MFEIDLRNSQQIDQEARDYYRLETSPGRCIYALFFFSFLFFHSQNSHLFYNGYGCMMGRRPFVIHQYNRKIRSNNTTQSSKIQLNETKCTFYARLHLLYRRDTLHCLNAVSVRYVSLVRSVCKMENNEVDVKIKITMAPLIFGFTLT